jgi:hypothetical protein
MDPLDYAGGLHIIPSALVPLTAIQTVGKNLATNGTNRMKGYRRALR